MENISKLPFCLNKGEEDMAIDRFILKKLHSCTYQPMRQNLIRLFLIRIEKAWHEEEALKPAW
ncbi:hypothetical protein QNH46_11375 [Paenibacillus woosongensis]|uniref:Uncharacterized protein n=1 Tax=Paenibacillus woosongensis TaxID=307580 RepID=A0AA95IEC5_9BACL|nr:hypothetical protein [Paenibacillus woosongensis]WHX51620.1 hypothetical protein QNH46_11375 [Paenibacillus woosongensis]